MDCKKGEYYCRQDKKCKPIPKGHHVMPDGTLMSNDEHDVSEGWSKKYKRSIDCNNPKGFSQRAHCQGRKKMKEAKDHEVSMAQSQLDKTIANAKKLKKKLGTKEKDLPAWIQAKVTDTDHNMDAAASYSEGNLHKWFKGSKSKDGKGGWVNVVTGGTCASDEPGEGTPKCVSSAKRASMTKKERLSAQRRKKAADPNQQQKSGAAKPTYVSTDKPKKKMKEEIFNEEDKKGKSSGKKDACYHKVKASAKVWPSAYASGRLVQCRKKGAKNWGTKKEEFLALPELSESQINAMRNAGIEVEVVGEERGPCWKGYKQVGMKKKGNKMVPNCVPVNSESVEPIEEARVPAQNGNIYMVVFNWRGKFMYLKVFFPETRKPSRAEVAAAIDKIYPGARLRSYDMTVVGQGDSYLNAGSFEGGNSGSVPNIYSAFGEEIEIVYEELIEEGYDEEDVQDAIGFALNEATVTFGHDTHPADDKMKRAKGRLRFLKRKAGEALSSARKKVDAKVQAVKDAPERAKRSMKDYVARQADRVAASASKVSDRMKADKKEEPRKTTYRGQGVGRKEKVTEGAAWTKKSGKNPKGGLNEKGRKSYERENPGSDLKAPSKKVGNPRRASFCARMKGMKKKLTSSKTANDPNSRINKSLRAWNC